ncbi:MAG: hypothetical protein EOO17_04995 [Chloroflexi bacterium]|nr:MAG: hypothetical protein EOO17_04995 [Chloroflexota bacterium]
MDKPSDASDATKVSALPEDQERALVSLESEGAQDRPEEHSDTTFAATKTTMNPVVSEHITHSPFTGAVASTDAKKSESHAKLFLFTYISSALSALSVLWGVSFLGYVVLDYLIKSDKPEVAPAFYYDLAPLYISVMASVLIFGIVHIVTSRYAAKKVADDAVDVKDWRMYRIIYATFSSILAVISAAVIASLVFVPMAQTLIAEDFESRIITIQVIGAINVFAWVGLLLWQERLVKQGSVSIIQNIIVGVGVLSIIVATAALPIAGKQDDRLDARASADLESIEGAIDDFKNDNDGALPASLGELSIESNFVKKRISSYKYTVKESESVSKSQATYQAPLEKSLGSRDDSMSDLYGADSGIDSDEYADMTKQQDSPGYRLCATFKTNTSQKTKDTSALGMYASTIGGNSASFRTHATGEVCFDRT